jgi:hypothetical protein
LPGRYTIKFLARDDETGRIGTYQTVFVVPNLNKATKQLPISSVVLSNQRVDTKQALFNTMKGKEQAKNDAVNPLVNGEGKLIPSVTRTFRTDRNMEIFVQAYLGGASASNDSSPSKEKTAGNSQVIAFVSLYRDGMKVMDSEVVQASVLPESRLGAVAIDLKVGIAKLDPGEYQCQMTVLDPSRNRAAFWQGPIAIR